MAVHASLISNPPNPKFGVLMKCDWQRVGAYAGQHHSVFIYLCISFPGSSESPAELINAVSVLCPLWVNAAQHTTERKKTQQYGH